MDTLASRLAELTPQQKRELLTRAASVSIAQATNPIKLIVNGVDITYKSDVPPQIINGRTLVPARALAESLGASVE